MCALIPLALEQGEGFVVLSSAHDATEAHEMIAGRAGRAAPATDIAGLVFAETARAA